MLILMFTKIINYHQINLIKDALIVFDIDETILKFKDISQVWWDSNYNEYYRIYDIHSARQKVLNKWIDMHSFLH